MSEHLNKMKNFCHSYYKGYSDLMIKKNPSPSYAVFFFIISNRMKQLYGFCKIYGSC